MRDLIKTNRNEANSKIFQFNSASLPLIVTDKMFCIEALYIR